MVALFQARALEKNLRLTLSLPQNPPAALLGDPTRIRQILLNLVDNAIKFTHQGEVELGARFEHDKDGIGCQFRVRDSGIGISAETQSRLFQAFSQADSSTTRRYGGTGLGLAVSSQLAGLMGGSAHRREHAGQGQLASACADAADDHAAAGRLPAPASVQLQGRILVVEDHPVNQKVLAHQLREMGLQYTVATNGTQALDLLATDDFDLVLMDWQMPEMDGLEATRRIRQLPTDIRHIPIIALTANAGDGFRDACLAAGASDYLSKPYTETALAALLTQWLPQARCSPPPAPRCSIWLRCMRAIPAIRGWCPNSEAVFLSTTEASLAALKRAIEQGQGGDLPQGSPRPERRRGQRDGQRHPGRCGTHRGQRATGRFRRAADRTGGLEELFCTRAPDVALTHTGLRRVG